MAELPEDPGDEVAAKSENIVNRLANFVISEVAAMDIPKDYRAPLIYGIGIRIATELMVHLQEPAGAPDHEISGVVSSMLAAMEPALRRSIDLSLEARRNGLVGIGENVDEPTIQ